MSQSLRPSLLQRFSCLPHAYKLYYGTRRPILGRDGPLHLRLWLLEPLSKILSRTVADSGKVFARTGRHLLSFFILFVFFKLLFVRLINFAAHLSRDF